MSLIKIGDPVVYVDAHGVARAAVVTQVWKNMSGSAVSGVNVVFVSGDEARTDGYGRQIERATSLCHMSVQPAHGMYWRGVDEVGKATEVAA